MPVANSISDNSTQNAIIGKLRQAFATHRMKHYRGWSTCRLCNMANGSGEIDIEHNGTTYVIPQGYLHYLEDHKVEGDKRLLQILK
jgi:hypothetical protein